MGITNAATKLAIHTNAWCQLSRMHTQHTALTLTPHCRARVYLSVFTAHSTLRHTRCVVWLATRSVSSTTCGSSCAAKLCSQARSQLLNPVCRAIVATQLLFVQTGRGQQVE